MIDSSSRGSVTPARPPCREDFSFAPLAWLPWAWLREGIPKSRGAVEYTGVTLWGGHREERVGREREARRKRCFPITLYILSSHAFIISLSIQCCLNWSVPTSVFSELPNNAHLLPVVSRHCKQQPPPCGVHSGPGSGLFSLPRPRLSAPFCSSSSMWFSVPATCSSVWKTSFPLVRITSIWSCDEHVLVPL